MAAGSEHIVVGSESYLVVLLLVLEYQPTRSLVKSVVVIVLETRQNTLFR